MAILVIWALQMRPRGLDVTSTSWCTLYGLPGLGLRKAILSPFDGTFSGCIENGWLLLGLLTYMRSVAADALLQLLDCVPVCLCRGVMPHLGCHVYSLCGWGCRYVTYGIRGPWNPLNTRRLLHYPLLWHWSAHCIPTRPPLLCVFSFGTSVSRWLRHGKCTI